MNSTHVHHGTGLYKADFAIVSVKGRSRKFNLKGTARNFNACMAGAAKITIAEVEELLPVISRP
jgi:3-oxoacid CoA-transferase subunit A